MVVALALFCDVLRAWCQIQRSVRMQLPARLIVMHMYASLDTRVSKVGFVIPLTLLCFHENLLVLRHSAWHYAKETSLSVLTRWTASQTGTTTRARALQHFVHVKYNTHSARCRRSIWGKRTSERSIHLGVGLARHIAPLRFDVARPVQPCTKVPQAACAYALFAFPPTMFCVCGHRCDALHHPLCAVI